MNSFWNNLYDCAKDRRYGMLFLTVLLAFPGLIILGATIYKITGANNLREYFLPALPGIGILLVALSWRIIRRARKRGREQLKYSPLSRDELLKARSKLTKNRNLKKS